MISKTVPGVPWLTSVLCFISCSSGGHSTTTPLTPPTGVGLGGSNYGWYYVDASCNREAYGVVYNYDTQAKTINSQLQQMYSNGQRRLRIPIFHARHQLGDDHGFD